MISPERIAEITALAEAATPGEWAADITESGDYAGAFTIWGYRGGGASAVLCQRGPWAHNAGESVANAAFIAAARTAVPDLLAEREVLREEIRVRQDAIDELVEVARLRGDNDLPHPCDDAKLWTARMIDAWGEVERIADGEAE